MRIGYESKRIFHNKTGLGNYGRDLIRILATFFPENEYFLYNPKDSKESLFQNSFSTVYEKKPTTFFYKKHHALWRQKGVVTDLKKDGIALFHGLSGEIPSGLQANGIKSIVTIHDLIFMRYPQWYSFFDRKIHFYKFKKAARTANSVIAISEQTKADIITYLKIPAEKITVVYQGCQDVFKKTYSETERTAVRQKFHLPTEFVLNVGTLERRKNALTIVKAIQNIDTTLVLIGKETAYTQEIYRYIETNGLQKKVLFLKNLPPTELAIVYQLATVFVYPSIFEGFGIPIIEALFSKTPVITTNSGVFPEAGGPHSVYVDPTNTIEMETQLHTLLHNKSLRNQMSEKGFEFVQKFNDEAIAQSIMKCYEGLF